MYNLDSFTSRFCMPERVFSKEVLVPHLSIHAAVVEQ